MHQNVLGVLQQLVLKKMYPAPVFTEEDYREEERKIRTKGKSSENKGSYKQAQSGKQYKSLHHIDDDDEPIATNSQKDNQNQKLQAPVEGAPKLKDDK